MFRKMFDFPIVLDLSVSDERCFRNASFAL